MELDVSTASGPTNTERVLSSKNILNLTADKPGLGSDDGFVFSRNNNRALKRDQYFSDDKQEREKLPVHL